MRKLLQGSQVSLLKMGGKNKYFWTSPECSKNKSGKPKKLKNRFYLIIFSYKISSIFRRISEVKQKIIKEKNH
jgi:hypothetical protein